VRHKKLFIVLAVVLLLIFAATALLVSKSGTPRQSPMPMNTPSNTPSPSPSPLVDSYSEDPHDDAEQAQQEEGRTNPVLTHLPYGNRFFELDFNGNRENKYRLRATIHYAKGVDDPAKKIEQQKPFVIQYLRSIGQPDGTYEIDYQTNAIDNSYNQS